ncbi:MAG TPA: hypothetical protein VLL25_18030, partial [Acidimicrobiales bacterium]|nr:hypothetical protein [Acidimicrobiales bacterium]
GVIQRYDDAGGDAIISDGGWWCEHENADGTPAPPARMTDPGEMERVECSDCGTVWMPWTYGGKRLAKAVVVAI